MKAQTSTLLSLALRASKNAHTSSYGQQTARILACSTSTHARSHATHATHATRTITTKTKNRGPAVERAREESHEFIVNPDYQDTLLPQSLAPNTVLQDASKWSHKTALECSITGRSYTYGQLVDGIMRFGGTIQNIRQRKMCSEEENGISTVALLSPNCPEYPIAFFGSMVAGQTVAPLNPTYTPHELAQQLGDSGASILVVDALLEPLADAALRLLHNKHSVAVVVNGASTSAGNGRPNLREIIADTNAPYATPVEVPLESTAVLPYSSGTTGKPKGVCISHRAFTNSLALFHHPSGSPITPADGDSQEVMVGLLPFFHIYGMMAIMGSSLANGGKIVSMPTFDSKNFLSVLNNHKVTRLHLVPPLLNFLAASPAVPASALANTHTVLCGAAPVPPASAALLKKKVGNNIFFQEGFGMTETLCTHLTPKGQEKLGWCGKLMPHVRAKVVDLETGASLPPGERGELCIDSPAMMTSYHNNAQATREVYDSEGWFKTGDVAVYDEEGFFSIVDRLKELIKVKGLQVSPSELEDLLLSYKGVADVGVVGVPDEKAGEVPKAYIVPGNKDLTKDEVNAFVSSRVAPHKQLVGGIVFVDELPKNPTGKLLRNELKKMAHGK